LDDPEDPECLVEARPRSLAGINAVLADGQLALQRKDSGGQYGQWPGQPRHIIPFFTSVMSQEQVEHARKVAQSRHFEPPWRVLFVGRLSREKNIHILLEALVTLNGIGERMRCDLVGDGPEMANLRRLGADLGLGAQVVFHGGVHLEQVLRLYATAHILVLASQSEGWPKAIAEGMAHGMVCVGSDRGLIPQMLADGRGATVQPGDVQGLAARIEEIVRQPAAMAEMSRRAAEWAQRHSLEGLREALRALMEGQWGVRLREAQHETAPIGGKANHP